MTYEVNEMSKDVMFKELVELVEELKGEIERLKHKQEQWETMGSKGLSSYYQGQKVQAIYLHNRICTILGRGTFEWLPYDHEEREVYNDED